MARKAKIETKPRTKTDTPTRLRQLAFKRSDVTRAIRAARDADISIGRVEIDGGRIVIIPKTGATETDDTSERIISKL
jgi:hypothetical protein